MAKRKPRKADDYVERDLAVLRLVRRLRIGLNDSLSSVLGDGNALGHVVRRLGAQGLLDLDQGERGLPGGLSYSRITTKGLAKIGITNVKPKKTLSNTTLNLAVALCWYATLEDTRRWVLLPEEVERLYGEAVPRNVAHFVTEEYDGGSPVVLRSYHALGETRTAKKNVVEFFEKMRVTAGIAASVASHDYGLLVLVPTPERCNQVKAAFSKDGLFGEGRLVVGVGPTAETLAPLLRKRRQNRG